MLKAYGKFIRAYTVPSFLSKTQNPIIYGREQVTQAQWSCLLICAIYYTYHMQGTVSEMTERNVTLAWPVSRSCVIFQ